MLNPKYIETKKTIESLLSIPVEKRERAAEIILEIETEFYYYLKGNSDTTQIFRAQGAIEMLDRLREIPEMLKEEDAEKEDADYLS
jgi:hypothetical protein